MSAATYCTGRKKVKTGCRTCKIRKVKCDEGRPACQRCILTGRVCDGYGIWGGGGSSHSNQRGTTGSEFLQLVPQPPTSRTDGKGYLAWFKTRTMIKLPGTYRASNFWSTLLLQASFSEPAVLHAVLALSSVHKRETADMDGQRPSNISPDEQEKFTLRNYSKAIAAISDLRPHFTLKDRASFWVTLITCVVFVCVEFLRGHFETGQLHLENGLNILGEMQLLCNQGDASVRLKHQADSTDDWIVQAFSRLHLQVELFKYTYEHSCSFRNTIQFDIPTSEFHSIPDGWHSLERLLNAIFYLISDGRQRASHDILCPVDVFEYQQYVVRSLEQWLVTWRAFEKARGNIGEDLKKAFGLLTVCHSMATIMAATCLSPFDESVFEFYTDGFIDLIKQSIALRVHTSHATSQQSIEIKALPGHLMDMSHSVIDMGWIPPLYFVAVKCRVHRIRMHAVRLLESNSHREGIWDSKTMACVARKVIELEEGDFYEHLPVNDDFSILDPPTSRDLEVPVLPVSRRLREIEVVLSGAPMDKVLLFCKRTLYGTDRRVLLSEYNVHLQRWID
ncbi:hypothetical protein K504DRAFT_425277 [Pleomassaria siparia CBS 279.74]|uniref:Zn(2)-C6 fungal-type domain-containing protein n=1 Tax=Pleomassaria siparia CBS 279.74 TaxID=1314801 RepID=A0A6G1KNP8_9PLEO|nr:hypothetical protein K504DRAFT_425277 [Pleomassaria siparia CBS 279.74]